MKAPARASRLAHEILYTVRYVVNAYPAVYLPFARIRHRDRSDWAVRPDTELVIEGFGRSGSTFAVDAFELAQPRPVRLAHHTHAAAQVITATRWRIPTLVIVRHPIEATTSHMARRLIGPRPALDAWIRYHRRILPYRDHLAIVRFETVTTDFGEAIRRVNARFGSDFEVFEHTPENEALVFRRIEERNRARFGTDAPAGAVSLARPTSEREANKRDLRAEVDRPELAALRGRAVRLYEALLPGPDNG